MSVLCDRIEEFILNLLEQCEGEAELRRSDVAAKFGCAPSQISYVLTTRFCPLRGYVVQGRRGGGGFTRIIRVSADPAGLIERLVQDELGGPVSAGRAQEVIIDLRHAGVLSADAACVMLAAVSGAALKCAGDDENTVRGSILRTMLMRSLAGSDK